MDIETFKIIIIVLTLICSIFYLRKYGNIPAVNLTLLCFVVFQLTVDNWGDVLFLLGVGFILIGVNMEYMRVYKRLKTLETQGSFNGA